MIRVRVLPLDGDENRRGQGEKPERERGQGATEGPAVDLENVLAEAVFLAIPPPPVIMHKPTRRVRRAVDLCMITGGLFGQSQELVIGRPGGLISEVGTASFVRLYALSQASYWPFLIR